MSYIIDPLSSPEVFFWSITGIYVLDDDVDFLELDALLHEAAVNLEKDPTHAGAARDFRLELENFDEDTKTCEIIASYIVRLWEDDDNEIELINKTITEELEQVGIQVDSFNFAGTGKRSN